MTISMRQELSKSFGARTLRLPKLDRGLIALTFLCSMLVLLAVVGPLVAPYSPDTTNMLQANQMPSAAHILGTDSLGRDIFSRILWGGQVSYSAAALIVLASLIVGTLVALVASWLGGLANMVTGGLLNVVIAIPGMLVALIVVTILGPGFWAPVVALAIGNTPYIARIIRGSALRERRQPYVQALLLSGVSTPRINLHILRNLSPLLLAQATLGFGFALLEFGAMSFIGLGVQPPTAEWGAMVIAGKSEALAGNMQQTYAAGAMIVISVVSFTLLGDRISRVLAVRP